MANEKRRTKGEALVTYVMDRYRYSQSNTDERRGAWREYYQDFRGTRSGGKQPWQANYIIPSLKDVIRVKTPLYKNILFANGLKSWDIIPSDPEDELSIPILKELMLWQLGCVGYRRGGIWRVMDGFLKQFEIYGYSIAKVPWREEDEDGNVVYEGPDIETWDVFSFFPDPAVLNVNESWVITRKRNVFVSYLRMLERRGVYHDVSDLKDTFQPASEDDPHGGRSDDRVELLEYHGEVPRDLLEGKISDEYQVSPYDDEYVKAIIVVGNEGTCLRNEAYPFRAGNIFVDASKDVMPNERFGIGTGEDIQAMAEELTNAHNKLTDCINIISNPNVVINPDKIMGTTSGVLLNYPGKVWLSHPGVEDVSKSFIYVNTSAQAAALSSVLALINALEEKIMKISQAVPTISPMVSKEGLPETLGATMMMQGNAAEPIKDVVRHCLEPWFQRVLEIFYKHNLQFFKEDTAYRVLGPERAQEWIRRFKGEIALEDISLRGNPTFLPRGVSVFGEKMQETRDLLSFLQMAQMALEPATDPAGNPVIGPDGNPVMVPAVDAKEIVKRIAIKMGFDNIEALMPSLARERQAREGMLDLEHRMKDMGGGAGAERRASPLQTITGAPVG